MGTCKLYTRPVISPAMPGEHPPCPPPGNPPKAGTPGSPDGPPKHASVTKYITLDVVAPGVEVEEEVLHSLSTSAAMGQGAHEEVQEEATGSWSRRRSSKEGNDSHQQERVLRSGTPPP